MKLNLIYDSKCKINTKWWKIKMKTRNLTQISLRNDPINRRMHGFSFRVSEDEVWSSRWEFSFLFRLNYKFKDLMGAEMSQEYRETNGAWNGGVNKENLAKFHGHLLPPRRTTFKEVRKGVAVDLRGSSRSTIAMRRPLGESMLLNGIRPIADGESRFIHVLENLGCVVLWSSVGF